MEDSLNSLFKKPQDNSVDSLFKPPTQDLNSIFKKPGIAKDDPRKKLSLSQIKEAEDNKAWAKGLDKTHERLTEYIPKAVAPILKTLKPSTAIASSKGFTHNMDEYGATINKGLANVAGAVGWESGKKSFDRSTKWWNDQRRMNEIETEDNKYAHLAGEMLFDPVNLTPAGVINKGTKVARVAKSIGAGVGIGAVTEAVKGYGNEDLTQLQKDNNMIMGAGIAGALNGLIAGFTRGKVTNLIKDVDAPNEGNIEEVAQQVQAVMQNPTAFGLDSTQAKQVSDAFEKLTVPKETPRVEEVVKEADIAKILKHPKAKQAIDMARDRYASQTYHERVGGSATSYMNKNNEYVRVGNKGEKNYHEGFHLSKADVNKIDKGNITPEIKEKLSLDIQRLEDDPNWANENISNPKLDEEMKAFQDDTSIPHDSPIADNGDVLDAYGNSIFANAGHNLAGGFGAGTVNAGSGMFDKDDTPEKMADRFIQGMAAGVIGVSGIKALRKTNPRAYAKVQSWFMDNNIKAGDKIPTEGVQLGVFAGKEAKGFKNEKDTHLGKYDGQERFEIDDSKAELSMSGAVELSKKGFSQLDNLITHDALFSNYPQLRNVIVKFDKNMKEHASFDGESTISLSNKFKSKDEMLSSTLHEIQHWVQNKEGFAGGGNFDEMMRQVDGKINTLEKKGDLSQVDAMNYKKDLEYLKNNRSAEAFKRYQNIAGEIEAREVQARKNLTEKERREIPNYENTSTMGDKYGDEAYNTAFMADMEGRHGDFNSAGVSPNEATLDFSRTKVSNTLDIPEPPINNGNGKDGFADLERLAKEKGQKDWQDLSKKDSLGSSLNTIRKEFFSDTFSAKYHESRDLVHTNTNKSNEEIGRLAKVLDTFDDATDKKFYQYLTKTGGDNLPKDVKDMADSIRDTIDNLGAELVARGDLDERGYKEWANAYLYRQYEPTASKSGLGGLKENFKRDKAHERGIAKEFNPTDIEKMAGWLNEHGFLKDEELLSFTTFKQMQDFLKSENRAGLLREGKLSITKTVGGKIQFRRDYTKTEREAMGEIESAKVAVPETLARLQRLKQHSDFLRRAKDIEGVMLDAKVVKDATTTEMRDAGYELVPPNPMYGALSGKWVRKDVYDDIGRTTADIHNLQNDARRLWNGYHGLWKKSKTVWNPTAHVNNFAGNLFLMHLGGVNATQLPKILAKGAKGMKALKVVEELEQKRLTSTLTQAEEAKLNGLKDTAKFALEAKNNGIFGKSQLNDILAGMENGNAKKGILGKLDETASKYYELEDNFNRLSFYQTLRETGRDAKTSKQMVDFLLPDYSKPLPKGWRFARDTGIAPFISWSYYTMPSILAMGLSKTGASSILKVVATISALQYALTNGEVTPLDDMPFFDTNKPEDFKGRRFAYSKDGDKIETVKLDRMIPYVELKNPINYVKSQVSGVIPNALYSMNGMQMYNGRPITYDNKSNTDRGIDWLKHIAKQYAPIPMPVMNVADLLDSSLRSKKKRRRNKTIEPRTKTQEALKNIGLNTMTYNKNALKREQKKK